MARVGPVAARVELLDLAVCAGRECLSFRVEALPAETLPLDTAHEPSSPPLSSTNWKNEGGRKRFAAPCWPCHCAIASR